MSGSKKLRHLWKIDIKPCRFNNCHTGSFMSTVTQSLLGLFETLEYRIQNRNTFAMNSVCQMAGDIVDWSKTVDIKTLENTPSNIFGQMMTLVSGGMTGKAEDAERSIRSIKASLPVLKKGLSRSIAKQS